MTPEELKAVWNKQVDRLGSRDPMEVLTGTPEILHEVVTEYHDERLQRSPEGGGWSPTQILGHMLDVEMVMSVRTRIIFCEGEGTLQGFDQEAWVDRLRHAERDPDDIVAEFQFMRNMNLHFWRTLSAEDLERTARHAEAGVDVSLAQLRSVLAGHDIAHLDQLERCLRE